VEADCAAFIEVAWGVCPSAPFVGVLVQPHRHDITRFVWAIVSSDTWGMSVGVLKALLEKSMSATKEVLIG
jgi:hypothetical protein